MYDNKFGCFALVAKHKWPQRALKDVACTESSEKSIAKQFNQTVSYGS